MLISISFILLSGLLLGGLCKKIHFPSLFGMIIGGIIIGPYALNLIDSSILNISAEIRKIALIVILIRAGLKLDLKDLRKIGRPAVMMCFVPACFEILGMVLIAPKILGISSLDAAILGAVIAAVSPAVIVPRMIKLIDHEYGTNKAIPQMILAGASVDDVFVIVMFTTFTAFAQGNSISVMNFVNIPISILMGIVVGLFVGFILAKCFMSVNINNVTMVIIMMSLSFVLSTFEDSFPIIPFASLIAIMCIGIAMKKAAPSIAKELSGQYDKIWIVAEIFLFVLVGTSVAIDKAVSAGISAIILLLMVILFRIAGVFVCLLGTELDFKEKIFCMIAYTPKATVQAAIGGLPLAMGLSCGEVVLTVSVIAILVSAPLGALGIDLTYKKLLHKKEAE